MVIIFPSEVIAETLIKEMTATEFDHVWMWFDPDLDWDEIIIDENGVETIIRHVSKNIIQQSHAIDGRIAIIHIFSEEDETWLETYLGNNVIFAEKLPEDWHAVSYTHLTLPTKRIV